MRKLRNSVFLCLTSDYCRGRDVQGCQDGEEDGEEGLEENDYEMTFVGPAFTRRPVKYVVSSGPCVSDTTRQKLRIMN